MGKNHEVFDVDALADEFPPISVKIGGKTYTMKNALSAQKMHNILKLDNLPEDEKYNESAAVLAELLDVPYDTFLNVDIRLIGRAATYIQDRIMAQSEGKDGTPTKAAPKKSPKSSRRSRRSSE